MITRQQALTEDEFHDCACRRYRRNGAAKTWKTRPGEWYIPVTFGLRAGRIRNRDAPNFHAASTCSSGRRR